MNYNVIMFIIFNLTISCSNEFMTNHCLDQTPNGIPIYQNYSLPAFTRISIEFDDGKCYYSRLLVDGFSTDIPKVIGYYYSPAESIKIKYSVNLKDTIFYVLRDTSAVVDETEVVFGVTDEGGFMIKRESDTTFWRKFREW